MEKTLKQYTILNQQLSNVGKEKSNTETIWNKEIINVMDELLDERNEDLEKLIQLNLI